MEKKTYFTLAEKDHYRMDDYENLFMASGDGTELKVGKKRAHLHPIVIDNPGAVLQLTWDEYNKTEYVKDLVLFKGKELTTEQENAKVIEDIKASIPDEPKPKMGVEIGMWRKEVGEWLRMWAQLGVDFGELPKTDPRRTLYIDYWANLNEALGIKSVKNG